MRPTRDRIREALFNRLAHNRWRDTPLPQDAGVVDGFAGTGALGLEALSRGAAHVTFLENDPAAQTKMQYAEEIVGRNPKAQEALQGDELFAKLFENYSKNLQMSIMQGENAQIGRIGVSQVT